MLVFMWAVFVVFLRFCLLRVGAVSGRHEARVMRFPGCAKASSPLFLCAHGNACHRFLWHRRCSGCRMFCQAGLLCVPVGGGQPDLRRCYAPPDLRPPRGLPARSPSALRASLGASPRCPARPRHRPQAPQPGPPAPPHLLGLVCRVWFGASAHRPATPRRRPRHRSLAHLHPAGLASAVTSPFLNPHPISHVIPPRPFQILKSDRWNCNVFRLY